MSDECHERNWVRVALDSQIALFISLISQVKPINVVSPVEDNIGSSNDWSDIEPQVTHIAFSEDGLHMATIDVKADASTSQSYSTSLKFWDRRASNAQASTSSLFEVQSQIDEPHR